MAESFLGITESASPDAKLHSWTRTIGANTVEESVTLAGEPVLATYGVRSGASAATANSHLMQIMAGASLAVRIRRITITASARAATAFLCGFQIVRLTTAGTGGGAVTPSPFDTADAASGATAMVLPTSKGTEGAIVWEEHNVFPSPTQVVFPQLPLVSVDFDLLRAKPLIIPAGTSNGIAVKNTTGGTDATAVVSILLSEVSFA